MGLPYIDSTEFSPPVRKEFSQRSFVAHRKKPSRREQDLPSLGYKAGSEGVNFSFKA